MEVPLEDIYEEDEAKVVINNENNATGENSGLHSTYYNIPNSIIQHLHDYITVLKDENQKQKEEINSLRQLLEEKK